jgi:hypothetical protein
MKKLTKEELNLALEAILFASCVDICAEWDEKDNKKLIDIAIKLKGSNDVKLEKIKLFGLPKLYEDKDNAKKIKKNFEIQIEK